MHKALAYKPLMRWLKEVAAKLLLERSHTAIATRGELLNRYVAKNVVEDKLFEGLSRRIDIRQQLIFDAAVVARDNQIDQLGHLDTFGGGVAREHILFDILVERCKEVSNGAPRRDNNIIGLAATLARVVVRDIEVEVATQSREYSSELFGRVVAGYLLERLLCIFGHIFGVVVSLRQKEHFASFHLASDVAVVDKFAPAQHKAYGVAREVVRLDSVGVRLGELDNHWLRVDSRKLIFHHKTLNF